MCRPHSERIVAHLMGDARRGRREPRSTLRIMGDLGIRDQLFQRSERWFELSEPLLVEGFALTGSDP